MNSFNVKKIVCKYKWFPFLTNFNIYDARYLNKQIQGGEIVFSYYKL